MKKPHAGRGLETIWEMSDNRSLALGRPSDRASDYGLHLMPKGSVWLCNRVGALLGVGRNPTGIQKLKQDQPKK
jgi:hypothetical protein